MIANRIAEIYVQDQLKGKLSATDKASGWLEQRLADAARGGAAGRAGGRAFKAKNNIVSPQGVTLNEQELSDLNRELIAARADLAERQAKLRLVRELRGRGEALERSATSPARL